MNELSFQHRSDLAFGLALDPPKPLRLHQKQNQCLPAFVSGGNVDGGSSGRSDLLGSGHEAELPDFS
jgi:hypothetical protein